MSTDTPPVDAAPALPENDRPMGLREHLLELRKRLRNAAIALFIATVASFWFSKPMFALLAAPLVEAMKNAHMSDPTLYYGSLTEAFWVQCKIAIYTGVFLGSPFIFHQIWQFVAPGLYRRERKVAIPFAVFSALFFIGGALFCYFFVFPAAFKFFLSYTNQNLSDLSDVIGAKVSVGEAVKLQAMPFMDDYLDLASKMLLAFGLVFEMPLLIFFLAMIGVVNHRKLWKFNRYAIIISFILGAILTPGPDVISQLMMSLPMIGLYNLSILVAYFVTKRREARLGPPPPPLPDEPGDEPDEPDDEATGSRGS